MKHISQSGKVKYHINIFVPEEQYLFLLKIKQKQDKPLSKILCEFVKKEMEQEHEN